MPAEFNESTSSAPPIGCCGEFHVLMFLMICPSSKTNRGGGGRNHLGSNRRRQSGDCGIRSATSMSGNCWAAEAQELFMSSEAVSRSVTKAGNWAVNGNRRCDSNKLCVQQAITGPKLKLPRSLLRKAPATARCPASNEYPDSNCCSSSRPPSPPKPEVGFDRKGLCAFSISKPGGLKLQPR